jgi:cellulose 1,4-beta-cellobiosidase
LAPPNITSVISGNNQVSLTWSISQGATSYNVGRSTISGGPYKVIATLGAINSYMDSTVSNGTTYYYVVSASNSSGTSPYSAQVSATPQT